MTKILEVVQAGVATGDDVQKIFALAKEGNYALPAVNCVNTDTVNSVLEAAMKAGQQTQMIVFMLCLPPQCCQRKCTGLGMTGRAGGGSLVFAATAVPQKNFRRPGAPEMPAVGGLRRTAYFGTQSVGDLKESRKR